MPQSDARRPAHDLAALDGAYDRLREVVEPSILHEEAIENGAQQERAAAFEGLFVERDGDLDAARRRAAAGAVHPAYHRCAVDAAHAADLALGCAVGKVAEHAEHFPQRLSILAGAPLDQAELVQAQHIDEPPGDRPGVSGLAAAP